MPYRQTKLDASLGKVMEVGGSVEDHNEVAAVLEYRDEDACSQIAWNGTTS